MPLSCGIVVRVEIIGLNNMELQPLNLNLHYLIFFGCATSQLCQTKVWGLFEKLCITSERFQHQSLHPTLRGSAQAEQSGVSNGFWRDCVK
jgi:hypothetical protein